MNEKVLVVDDNKVGLEILIRRLKSLGYVASSTCEAAEVITKLKSGNFQLLILDLLMPEIDGFEIARQVKSDDELRNVKIIAYSAGSLSDLDKAKKAGCDEVCLKDGNTKGLLKLVEKLTTA